MNVKEYCDNCERTVTLTEDGYCPKCGKHADNMSHVNDMNVECSKCGRIYCDHDSKY